LADYDSARAEYDRSVARVAAARALLDLLVAGSRQEDIDEAAAELKRTRANALLLIDAARGVILRGAGQADLWRHSLVLWAMALATLTFRSLKFRKQIA
jgi:hypothetical protein